MFDKEKKPMAKPGPLKRNKTYRQVSGTVLASCYVASAAIVVISVSEAIKGFGTADTNSSTFYIILAVLGVLFSVFITVLNKRNKKLIAQNKNSKVKKIK